MIDLPDANKLTFFTSDIFDDEFEFDSDDDDEEIIAIRESKKTISEIMNENVCMKDNDRQLILGMLTWSRKERWTIPQASQFCIKSNCKQYQLYYTYNIDHGTIRIKLKSWPLGYR